jgi:RecB family endonuclease NucS
MQYAGGIVKHLGLSMYRGAVPAIAELISNSWDADASKVDVSVPFGTGLKDHVIVIKDDGHGMSWEDVQESYLIVGLDRRVKRGETTDTGRLVMGRKGLGKLAGFGIARVMDVRTVRNGHVTHFRMDFDRMTKGGEAKLVESYQPEVLEDADSAEPNGTTITLSHLQLTRAIVESEFRESMSRRFAILGKGFDVVVNDTPIEHYSPDLQFEFEGPDSGSEDIPGVGQVKWWIGFTLKPIPTDHARGISILVREKMAQAPFFFDLSGGAYGQVGMQYMTGEVYADQLDAERDHVGTDRQGIIWTEPMPEALLKWGEQKVRELLRLWAAQRATANEQKLVNTITALGPRVEERIGKLQPSEQKEARSVIRRLASIESVTDDPERAKDLLDMVLRAFEDSSFFALLKALKDSDKAERDEVLRLVTELDVLETVKLAEVSRARVGVIQTFRKMIEDDVKEKPDMQDFLSKHPWLIHPEWQVVEHEVALQTILVEHFNLERTGEPDSDKRVDFFCISTRGRFLVVEVKRPSQTLGEKEITQAINYVGYLKQYHPNRNGMPATYQGVLVGHHLSADAGVRWRGVAHNNGVDVLTWAELLDVAERTHKDMLEVMKQRAPGDARVEADPAPASPPAETA